MRVCVPSVCHIPRHNSVGGYVGVWLAGSAAMVRRHMEGLRDAAVLKVAVLQTALDSMGRSGGGEGGESRDGAGSERGCRAHIPLSKRPTERECHLASVPEWFVMVDCRFR